MMIRVLKKSTMVYIKTIVEVAKQVLKLYIIPDLSEIGRLPLLLE